MRPRAGVDDLDIVFTTIASRVKRYVNCNTYWQKYAKKLICFRGGCTECRQKISACAMYQKKAVHSLAIPCSDRGISVHDVVFGDTSIVLLSAHVTVQKV